MATITKKELIERIADETQQSKAGIRITVQRFLDLVGDELASGNRLEFRDFGVFDVRQRAARKAHNPKTLEAVEVPTRRTVKFKPGRKMREKVQSGTVHTTQHNTTAPAMQPQETPEVVVRQAVVERALGV